MDNNRKLLIDTFNTFKDQTLSYFKFKRLLVEDLGVKIPDEWGWIYEDLEFLLDSDDTSDLCLEDVQNWLKSYGYDLEATIR